MSRHAAPTTGVREPLTNIALGGLAAVLVLAALLWTSGHVSAWLTRAAVPTASLVDALGVLANPGDPAAVLGAVGLHPAAYWTAFAVQFLALTAIAWAGSRLLRRRPGPRAAHGIDGVATGAEIARAASVRALITRASTLRPSLENPAPADVGYRLGTSKGRAVWPTVEDSMLLVGPPRSGKGHHVVIPFLLDAPGAVLTTSTRPDNLATTIRARARRGPVVVFDPQGLAPGLPARPEAGGGVATAKLVP